MMRFVAARDIKLKKRSADSHKGRNGIVLVLGGSEEYVGAPLLAGLGALRAGADLVYVAAPSRVAWAINALSPDLITRKLSGNRFLARHVRDVRALVRKADVVLLGNGIGSRSKAFVKAVARLCSRLGKRMVIDADALRQVNLRDLGGALLTPHKGELDDLLENSGSPDIKSSIGDNVVLVKGKVDRIVSRTRVVYNRTGNAGMTVGGTGDVLAGMCAGFLAQGNSLFMSAMAGAYYAGKVGDELARSYGVGFMASDMLSRLRKVMRRD